MREQWKNPPSCKGYYAVSNLGRVKRAKGGSGAQAGRILVAHLKSFNRGYPKVATSIKGQKVDRVVHQLVAEAFLGPRPKGHQVNHKNGIKTDNRLSNLEYVTHGDNIRHSMQVLHNCEGEQHWAAKLTEKDVLEIRAAYTPWKIGYRQLSKKYGVSQGTIVQVIKRITWDHI